VISIFIIGTQDEERKSDRWEINSRYTTKLALASNTAVVWSWNFIKKRRITLRCIWLSPPDAGVVGRGKPYIVIVRRRWFGHMWCWRRWRGRAAPPGRNRLGDGFSEWHGENFSLCSSGGPLRPRAIEPNSHTAYLASIWGLNIDVANSKMASVPVSLGTWRPKVFLWFRSFSCSARF